MRDVSDCSLIVLPGISALDNDTMEYFDDHYIDLTLTSIEGKLYEGSTFMGTEKVTQKSSVAIVHIKLIFDKSPAVPNKLRKRIAAIAAEKIISHATTSKERKQIFSTTYVPFFDRLTRTL